MPTLCYTFIVYAASRLGGTAFFHLAFSTCLAHFVSAKMLDSQNNSLAHTGCVWVCVCVCGEMPMHTLVPPFNTHTEMHVT